MPICGGLAMLGFTGTHAASDIAAHGTGFFCGLAVVLPFVVPRPRILPDWFQDSLKIGTVMIFVIAWRAAILFAQRTA